MEIYSANLVLRHDTRAWDSHLEQGLQLWYVKPYENHTQPAETNRGLEDNKSGDVALQYLENE